VSGLEPASVEVERFEQTDACLEVRGRWFGIRGRRFMRPALTASAAGAEQRMLAVLDHKPWAAEEGETWLAAFPCSRDVAALDRAELTVAPDLTVALPPPSPRAPARRPGASRSQKAARPATTTAKPARSTDAIADEDREAVEQAETEEHAPAVERAPAEERLRLELDAAQRARAETLAALDTSKRELARLRDELERERSVAAVAAQAASERDQARAAREEAARERDAAGRERDAARGERDSLQRERNRMLAEREHARSRVEETTRQWELTAELGTRRTLERDAVVVERERLARELDEALAAQARAAQARDAALDERDRLAGEREAALRARDRAADQLAEARRERERITREKDVARASSAAAQAPTLASPPVERARSDGFPDGAERRARPFPPALQGPSAHRIAPIATGGSAAGQRVGDMSTIWRQRFLAVSALLIALVVVVALLLAR